MDYVCYTGVLTLQYVFHWVCAIFKWCSLINTLFCEQFDFDCYIVDWLLVLHASVNRFVWQRVLTFQYGAMEY